MDAIWPSNVSQADWLLDGLERAAGRPLGGMRVALLGLTFKAGTDDLRESPAVRLGRVLLSRGAIVAPFDPVSLERGIALISQGSPDAPIEAAESAAAACVAADAVVVATEWPEFAELEWAAIAPTMAGNLVIDGRRIVDDAVAGAAGLRVVALGVEARGAVLQPVD
jgi:UDPglucose 6-dehydrogenase